MKYFYRYTLIIFVFLAIFTDPKIISAQEPTLTYGPEEIIYDSPIDYFPDLKYFTYINNNILYGVLPGQSSYLTLNPLASSLTTIIPMTNMSPGTSIDSAGSWLQGVYVQSPALIHGFYHSEDASIGGGFNDKKTISYAYTTNGGFSWIKPDYPNNQIITKDPTVAESYAGDPDVKIMGDYIYALYGSGSGKLSLARSSLIDGGKPGTWYKYYCVSEQECSFTEPGLGGKSTPVLTNAFDPFFSFNTYLNKYLLLDSFDIQGWDGGGYQTSPKLNFRVSDDLIHWTVLFQNPIELPSPPSGWQYFYPSIISLTGDSSQSGQEFWLYYTRRQPSDWRKRYLLRRKITLTGGGTTATPANDTCRGGDINRDGVVDITDRNLLVADFFKTTPSVLLSDINGDDIVDIEDYSLMVKDFGETGVCL